MMTQQALYTETGILPATAPFDFEESLSFIGDFLPTHGEQTMINGVFTKAILINGYIVAFSLTNRGTIDAPMVGFTLFSKQPLPVEVKQAVLERITFFLSLNDDLSEFYAIGRKDAHFAPIIERLYGLHHVKFLTLAEIGCWAILTQRVAIPIAAKIKHNIVENYGDSIEVDGQVYWAFPELDRLARVSPDEWMRLIHNERKALYMSELMNALNGVDEEFLRTAPYEEAEAWLRGIKGIGEWSAAFILLRGEGRIEKMLLNLKPFLAILPNVYGNDETMESLSLRYGDWFGYWGYYMRTAN
ncbi:MAG: DNA-3-methyladenine glycosylase 2 family protein [Ktedonobacteraceae bacterium]